MDANKALILIFDEAAFAPTWKQFRRFICHIQTNEFATPILAHPLRQSNAIYVRHCINVKIKIIREKKTPPASNPGDAKSSLPVGSYEKYQAQPFNTLAVRRNSKVAVAAVLPGSPRGRK